MSRGLGHVQRKLCDLMESAPEGAWSRTELCRIVYPDSPSVTRAQRTAVGRALRAMLTNSQWNELTFGHGERVLYNTASAESRIRGDHIKHIWVPSRCSPSDPPYCWNSQTTLDEFKHHNPHKVALATELAAGVGVHEAFRRADAAVRASKTAL